MSYRTSTYLYSTGSDHFQQRTSLAIVPRLPVTLKHVWFRVCQGFRNRDNFICVCIFEGDTLEQLKEKIWKYLHLTTKSTDFSLTKFNDVEGIWMPIDDANALKRIVDLNLPENTTLNVEPCEDININQQPTPTINLIHVHL
jgi:hypothetical protein